MTSYTETNTQPQPNLSNLMYRDNHKFKVYLYKHSFQNHSFRFLYFLKLLPSTNYLKTHVCRLLLFNLLNNMQDECISSLSYGILQHDSPLNNLFLSTDQHQQHNFNRIQENRLQERALIQLPTFKDADIQRGYASDESPQKKTKNKRIKKRKAICPIRVDPSKQRTKKFYIQSLQNRVSQLELQIERLKKLNKLNLQYIKRINDSQLIMNGFFQHRQKIIQKLQKLTNADNPDERKIRNQAISLLQKQGSYGQERIKAVQYYFKQMAKMIVTNSHKYMAEAAIKNSDLFNPASIDTWEQWRKQLFLNLNLSPEKLSAIAEKKMDVLQLHDKFNKKLLQMYSSKCQLLNISRQIQILFQKMNNQLTPLQTGRLICFLEKYKFQGDFYGQDAVRKMYQELSDQTTFSYNMQSPPFPAS